MQRGPVRPPQPAIDAARQQMMQANKLLEAGHHSEAAEIFARLSIEAEQHNMLLRAAQLAARSASGFLQAERLAPAVRQGKRAANLSFRFGDPAMTARIARRMMEELEQRGHTREAQQIGDELDSRLRLLGLSLADAPAGSIPTAGADLPGACPACGGPVRPDEVHWFDETSLECAYCGTVIKVT
jgi:hypothetical protein